MATPSKYTTVGRWFEGDHEYDVDAKEERARIYTSSWDVDDRTLWLHFKNPVDEVMCISLKDILNAPELQPDRRYKAVREAERAAS